MQSLARHNIKATLLVGAFHGVIPNDAYWSGNPPNTTGTHLNGLGDTRKRYAEKQDRSHENLRGFYSLFIGMPVVIAALGFGVFDLIQHHTQQVFISKLQ